MDTSPRPHPRGPDRRSAPRGGRRAGDRPGRHPRVLIVDPYDGARHPCAKYLGYCGFHVEEADDAQSGLRSLHEGLPAVMLMDLSVASQLNEFGPPPEVRSIPMIVMAASFEGLPPTMRWWSGLLVKPFALTRMLEEIRRVLAKPPDAAIAPVRNADRMRAM
jgi:DNA-binding response OmpR family regulator